MKLHNRQGRRRLHDQNGLAKSWPRRALLAMAILLTIIAEVVVPAMPSASSGSSLTNVAWTTSSSQTSATSVTYNYNFTTATSATLTSFTFTVPSGTSGSPSLSSVKIWAGYNIALSSPTVALSGTTLTLSFGSLYMPSAALVVIQIAGLTNTASAGTYTSTITTNGSSSVDSATSPSYSFTATTLSDAFVSTSSTKTAATGVSYSYGLITASTQSVSSITLALPPGTSGTPVVGSVSPSSISGGTVTLSAGVLTYSFTATSLSAGTTVAITITGLTNPSNIGNYPGELVTTNGGTAVDSGVVSALGFTSTQLTSLSLSTSATSTGATGVSYTFGFTTATAQTYSSFNLGLPPGTSGTPTIGTLSVQAGYAITLPSPVVVLSGSQLQLSFTATYVPAGAVVSIQINGLTNTPTPASYTSSILTLTNVTSALAQVDSGVTNAVTFTSTALRSLSFTASSTSTGATGVTYTFGFGLTTNSTLSSITMTVPPGTSGTPTLGTVTPAAIAGGTIALSGQTLTYSFTSTSVSSSVTISVAVSGLTNTSTAGSYASTITAYNAGNAVASGATASVGFTSSVLTNLSWGASSTQTSTTGVNYSYQMTTGSGSNLSSITMSVPAGTSGTPTVGSLSAQAGYSITLPSSTVALSGTTLTLSFTSTYLPSATVVSMQINGITNTATPGSYTSSITTYNASTSVDSGTTAAVSFNSTVLGSPTWSTSSNAVGATGVGYTYSFGFPDTAELTTITMTVPSGTGGTPAVGAVSPSSIVGGTVSLSGRLLTYSFPAVIVSAGSILSIQITGLTNTTTAGSYSSTITASDAGTSVASGTTPTVTLTSTVLTSLSWSSSSTYTQATGVTYTFGFHTSSNSNLTAVTMTVPPGTGGTPGVGTVSAGTVNIASASASLSGTTLTFSFTSVWVPSGTVFSIQITGLTNTATAGSYSSAVSTKNGGATLDSGTTPALGFYAASVSITPPSSLGWSAGLSVTSLEVVNQVSAGQQYGVSDQTGTNSGWNVTLSATTFTQGTHTLNDNGTLWTNGSLTQAYSTSAPSVTCISTCVNPTNQVVYPVAITTAPTAPSSVVIFSANAGTGSGSFTIGGSSSAQPVGWWLEVPPNVYAGSYTSVITFAIGSGP